MAQIMLQMQRLWNGSEYEDIQGVQQGTILRSVSILVDIFLNQLEHKNKLMKNTFVDNKIHLGFCPFFIKSLNVVYLSLSCN